MKDGEDVDDRCMKDDVSVGSVARRHGHDRGNGNGIGSVGGHVPVGSRIDMSQSEVCRGQDVWSFVMVRWRSMMSGVLTSRTSW